MRVCLCVLAMAMAVRARTLKALHGARSCVGHGSGPPHAIRPIPIGVLVKTCEGVAAAARSRASCVDD